MLLVAEIQLGLISPVISPLPASERSHSIVCRVHCCTSYGNRLHERAPWSGASGYALDWLTLAVALPLQAKIR